LDAFCLAGAENGLCGLILHFRAGVHSSRRKNSPGARSGIRLRGHSSRGFRRGAKDFFALIRRIKMQFLLRFLAIRTFNSQPLPGFSPNNFASLCRYARFFLEAASASSLHRLKTQWK
jgi:hypothetical protein